MRPSAAGAVGAGHKPRMTQSGAVRTALLVVRDFLETKMTLKVAWLSRHPLGADQLVDLKRVLRASEIEVVSENVTWAASPDNVADAAENMATWRRIASGVDVVAGVIPPVALEAAMCVETSWGLDAEVWAPVSRQSREVRADGSAQIAFHHVRWARIR